MSLRALLAIAFGTAGAIGILAVLAALWLILRYGQEDPERLGSAVLIFGGAALLVLGGVLAVAWAILELRVGRPLMRLTRRLEIIGHSGGEGGLDWSPGEGLEPLFDAVRLLLEELSTARQEVAEAMASARADSEEQKGRLEAILRDLSEGVLVCNLNHQVLLYNQAALRILETPEELGLGRSLFQILTKAPILHSLERLQSWFANESPGESGRQHTAACVCTTTDARLLLHGCMTLVLDPQGTPTSYVLVLTDVSRELDGLTQRDDMLYQATEGMRSPLANLRAAAETIDSHPDLDETQREAFEKVILSESIRLTDKLEELAKEYRKLVTGPWSMNDIYGPDLINFVRRHLEASDGLEVTLVGRPAWLRGDSHILMLALEHLTRRVAERTGVKSFDLETWHGPRHCYIDLRWSGEAIPSRKLDDWLSEHLPGAVGARTLRDVLERHGSEPWSRQEEMGKAMLRLPLPAAPQPEISAAREPLPPRPEFYDFDLIHRQVPSGALSAQRLADLTYVVFDTETTGLRPSAGDEIVSIAGVRIVNQRILSGESFERLVNPRRLIPDGSTRFHGITDEMVKSAPPIHVVLPQFKTFIADAVLVAHNAAFDMKFLRLKEAETGLTFDNPVLDTLLLSVWLNPEDEDHSLDAIAARFGVEIVGRHTALGDAMVTAAVLLRMFRLLRARGITTLQEALDASERTAEVRKQQAAF